MRQVLLAAVFAVVCAPALAEDAKVIAPSLKVGDLWSYDETNESGQSGFLQRRLDVSVERVSDASMEIGVKQGGAPTGPQDRVFGLDWSKSRMLDGKETITTRPYAFPMTVGQSWAVDYVDPTRRGAQVSVQVRRTYKVVGWEDIQAPAGAFHALKIEANGADRSILEVPATAVSGAAAGSGGATTVTHAERGGKREIINKIYEELYYVPEVKNYVKYVHEQYSADGVRLFRQSQMMVSYKVAP